ncbi:molybdopterin molybdochelatase /molybdenum cofactor cytidylyltransferase [Tistlia consotensis]|uniref:Molybdopterin molybdochelatase /molybdenum cofactor cytidylyltransferase n=1 Tax=Tistlia consotensis USBA 355 TaxID=560819 RepID=A0A1Y6BN93_9PROT|nr:molybdopterin-binding/glycosyltransferase family 2 protein [Tistlia consotensis]SMF20413.1 molybdopterin molybdochelatase /molybdenum cofactor cytidylyltransferase [Tistlia consotensis USBA 355]SNR47916.1 molybdopterin molybdochelatase /molybdenum cofactor cytidylyltransferase [Tistlia consotensis]
MNFGALPVAEAEGALLAHSVRQGGLSFKKGRRLSAEDVAVLRAAGIGSVIAATLEPGDLHEDEAAARIARALAGPADGRSGAKVTAAFTGRCNLVAEDRGLFLVEPARIDAVNALHEAITVATLPAFEPVEPRQMLATVKIIPFSAPAAAVEQAVALLEDPSGREPAARVAAFRPRQVGLVQTALPGTKPALLEKGRSALDARLSALGCPPAEERRCGHDAAAIAAALHELQDAGCGLLLVSGASAIVDRRDVVPAGIVAAGGRIAHFGMPVDPGNLLLLAELDGRPVLGLPGCARAPKVNGFDWVLQRLIADLPVAPADVTAMGVGGLLKEIGGRPLPRAEAVEGGAGEDAEAAGPKRLPRIAALVLAGGQGRRMGGPNKLLLPYRGEPLLRSVVRAAQESDAAEVLVVTGHQREAVKAALAGLAVPAVHNPDYAEGLSTSLKAGLAALAPEVDGVVVLLGDMPRVEPAVIDKLIAAFDPLEGRAICQPSWHGKRGNPVLFARRFFAELKGLGGDVGAKPLLADYPELVCEVPVERDSVLADVDTPEAYRALSEEAAKGIPQR